jgi:predicted transcriptional regulator
VATITIDLSDQQYQTLQALAHAQGMELNVLLSTSLIEWLTHQQADFTDAVDHVLAKNAELYRRLA